MDEAVAPNSQGSGDLPIPPPPTLVDKSKSKKPRKSKTSVAGTPVKALTAVRDPASGKFVSPRLADASSKERAKGDNEVNSPPDPSPVGSFPLTGYASLTHIFLLLQFGRFWCMRSSVADCSSAVQSNAYSSSCFTHG